MENRLIGKNNCNPELTELIDKLKLGLKNGSKTMDSLRDPVMLIEALEDINHVIGNSNIKVSIKLYVEDILADIIRKKNNSKLRDRNSMLNIMLYGPPGTGKTMLSEKIGKILYAAGQLTDYQVDPTTTKTTTTFYGIDSVSTESLNALSIIISIAFIGLLLLSTVIGMVPKGYGLYVLIAGAILVSLVLLYFYFSPKETQKQVAQQTITVSNNEERTYVVHATRSHFVGEYVGSSAIKTRLFLQQNLGKVIFLDEAYGLIQGYDDKFGNEAANELVQFMSRYPRAIIFIFAGYEKDIKRTLFKYQEGFKRRFRKRWHCPGYTPEELFEIFLYQVHNDGWDLKQEDIPEIRRLVIENADIFKAYGGDIESVVDNAKVRHSRDLISEDDHVEGYSLLTKEHVKKGIEDFRLNSDLDREGADDFDKKDIYERNIMDMISKYR